ncbi:MAG TPA: riboflavin kinase [Atribacteraceae bacterium]|nr:riboflavin kinase [Atribacteraceae bacterium]
MKWDRGFADIEKAGVLVLGFFDGLHRGHCQVLDEAFRLAADWQCPCELLTLYPHPDLTSGQSDVAYLTTYREKWTLFQSRYPAGRFRFLRFDRTVMATPPDRFLRWLLDCFSPRGICVGEDFRFGYRAAGDTGFLRFWGAEHGVGVTVLPPVLLGGAAISSSRIRECLRSGNAEEAARLLGYPYQVFGRVRSGRRIGRTLGFPTINLYPSSRKLLPRDGVYRGEVLGEEVASPALVYVGTRPTLGSGGRRVVEAYLRGKPIGDLYGKRLSVAFHGFIRGEMVFRSLEDLRIRILQDLQALERYLHYTGGMLHYNLNIYNDGGVVSIGLNQRKETGDYYFFQNSRH